MPGEEQGVAVSAGRYALIPRVLAFIHDGREVLLLKGAPDKKIWPGKYNGVGGHVERDEDVRSAMLREIREETGLAVRDLRLRGVVTIDTGEAAGIGLFVFTARAENRETMASAEGTLAWAPLDRALKLELVEDLPILMPKALAMRDGEEPFAGRYSYDSDGRLVVRFAESEGT